MSPATAIEPALDAAFLAAAERRAQRVAELLGERPGSWYRALGPIRESAIDVPALVALARAGLRAQLLIEQHDGWSRRLQQVRELHGPEDRGGGLIVCLECSRPFRHELWPCRTMQMLDGMPEP